MSSNQSSKHLLAQCASSALVAMPPVLTRVVPTTRARAVTTSPVAPRRASTPHRVGSTKNELLRNQTTHFSRTLLIVQSSPRSNDGAQGTVEYVTPDPQTFLVGSCATYAVMTAAAQVLCAFAEVHPDVRDATAHGFNADAAALWMVPLLASLTVAVTQADKVEFLREVKVMLKEGVLPSVAPLGALGILALSVGAGIGEEAMFRGFLMPWVDLRLESFGLNGDVSALGALATTSLFFGALHAITPAYAIWATWASVLFSIEYVRDGLGSAMFTHALYDYLAFLYIIVSWMPDRAPEASE